jgi:hypothetical protein
MRARSLGTIKFERNVAAARDRPRLRKLRDLQHFADSCPGQGKLAQITAQSEPTVADYPRSFTTGDRSRRLAVTRRMEKGIGALNGLKGIAQEKPSLSLVAANVG